MNFKELYTQAKERAELLLISLWARGNHPMRPFTEEIFRREPLMATPVFQSMFPWEIVTSNTWQQYFEPDVISKLEIGIKWPPRTNQAESWKEAAFGKSIVVTSGTGSGKTESFLYPVLNDLYKNKDKKGIKAIFLYPLNALMEDQRTRMEEACTKLGLTFAVYNGSTPEKDTTANQTTELLSREAIRNNPPDILLTNPSMLEYILVRDKDQEMINRCASSQSLKWIVIDEAHTFTGSATQELQLELKRTICAFGRSVNDIQFACTSATIGGANSTSQLQNFISKLTGKKPQDIAVIGGNRVVPPIDLKDLQATLANETNLPAAQVILNFRNKINQVNGMSLEDIWTILMPTKKYNIVDALDLLDRLCEIKVNGVPLLALRAHFHMRTISGLYACGNPLCKNSLHSQFGNMTTYHSSTCDCGAPFYEVKQCTTCNSFLLTAIENGEILDPQEKQTEYVHDYFYINPQENDNADDSDPLIESTNDEERYLWPLSNNYNKPVFEAHEAIKEIHLNKRKNNLKNSTPNFKTSWVILENNGRKLCPCCGKSVNDKRIPLMSFRTPVSFFNSNLANVFLDQSSLSTNTWGKYLAFTDSRQGTAVSAKTFNIEIERNNSRRKVYNTLHYTPTVDQIQELHKTSLNAIDNTTLKDTVINSLMQSFALNPFLSLEQTKDLIIDEQIFNHLANEEQRKNPYMLEGYKSALLRQLVARRALRGDNFESLGLATLDYVALNSPKVTVPTHLRNLITSNDWKDFLKIFLDYVIRMGNHLQNFESYEKEFVRDIYFPSPIDSPHVKNTISKPWPKVKRDNNGYGKKDQSRIVRLLCIALGINNPNQLDQATCDKIDKILVDAFTDLTQNTGLLKEVKDKDRYALKDDKLLGTYYLDLSAAIGSDRIRLTPVNNMEECPVTHYFIDTKFLGYSPVMGTGEITTQALEPYKIPTNSQVFSSFDIKNGNLSSMKAARHDNITFGPDSPFLAAEHSGQQDRALLKDYTKEFTSKPPKLNVLQCSTTMEMGVDIGDIDFVLMTTVPPKPANYMQRIGRAGRNNQTKAAAFTFCNNTPTAHDAFKNPLWAIDANINVSKVVDSNIILQRHINAFFFRDFITSQNAGMKIMSTVEDFMSSMVNSFIQYLKKAQIDQKIYNKFLSVFGSNVSYSTRQSLKMIQDIVSFYKSEIKNLLNAQNQSNKSKKSLKAINRQIASIESQNLLRFLSENQFLPNANMPTGIMTFYAADKELQRQLDKIVDDIKMNQLLLNKTPLSQKGTREAIQMDIAALYSEFQKLKSSRTVSRDGRIALNEFAPGQEVVINEKNFESVGIQMNGQYDATGRVKTIHFCNNCGHIEYSSNFQTNMTCSSCGHIMNGILKNGVRGDYTAAYEPVGFTSDINENESRRELTFKRFYDIQPVLLEYASPLTYACYLVEASSSKDYEGEILFYNAGDGHGFAICPRCGRSALESNFYTRDTSLPQELEHHQHPDDSHYCQEDIANIKRNVVLTARHQTSYTVLALKNPDGSYITDEDTIYSLGIMLKRAFANYLGIDENEIDFGIRQELGRTLLFIYDTAKGGSGYSTLLSNYNILQDTLDIAYNLILGYQCNCHLSEGACTTCLFDRTTIRFNSKLSKAKALEWLKAQSLSRNPIPPHILTNSGNAKLSLLKIDKIIESETSDSTTSEISLFVSDEPGDFDFRGLLDATSIFANALDKTKDKGINTNVLVEFHPSKFSDPLDLIPFKNIGNIFPNISPVLVNDLGNIKPIISVKKKNGTEKRYFIEDFNALSISEEWGLTDCPIYYDNQIVSYTVANPPVIIIPQNETLKEGVAAKNSSNTSRYFRDIIKPGLGISSNMDKEIIQKLKNKNVSVIIGDSYLNSFLAIKMAVGLIKEISLEYGFKIDNIDFQIESRKRKCQSDSWNQYSYISANLPSEEVANEYLEDECKIELDIEPSISPLYAHHRFIRFETPDNFVLELRPDHGIAGGWKSNSLFKDIQDGIAVDFFKAPKSKEDIIYYLLLKIK